MSKIASWSSFRDAMDTTSSPAPEKNLLPKTNLLHKKNRDVPLAPRQPLPGEGFLTRQSSNQERDSTNRSGSCCTIRGREGRTRDLFPTRSTGPLPSGPMKNVLDIPAVTAMWRICRTYPRRAAQTLLSRRSSSSAAAIASLGKASLSSCSPNVGCSGVL